MVDCPGCGQPIAPKCLAEHVLTAACRHRTLHRDRLALGWVETPNGAVLLPALTRSVDRETVHHYATVTEAGSLGTRTGRPMPGGVTYRTALFMPAWASVALAFSELNRPGMARAVFAALHAHPEVRVRCALLCALGGAEAVRAELLARRLCLPAF